MSRPKLEDPRELWCMKLHETKDITDNLSATRVPGGWLYTVWVEYSRSGEWGFTTTFVPKNEDMRYTS